MGQIGYIFADRVGVITNGTPFFLLILGQIHCILRTIYFTFIQKMETYPVHWPQFYTATIHERKNLLLDDRFKDIVIFSLRYLVVNKKIRLFAFVIMSNHIHLIWQSLTQDSNEKHRHNFMKFTAQQMKFELLKSDEQLLTAFKVDKKDREYQLWRRNALSIDLFSEKVFLQKMEYIHNNPVKAGLCRYSVDYKYSSAGYYNGGEDTFGILSGY